MTCGNRNTNRKKYNLYQLGQRAGERLEEKKTKKEESDQDIIGNRWRASET